MLATAAAAAAAAGAIVVMVMVMMLMVVMVMLVGMIAAAAVIVIVVMMVVMHKNCSFSFFFYYTENGRNVNEKGGALGMFINMPQRNPPLRVGEILCSNVKYTLRCVKIAEAAGGFYFTEKPAFPFHLRLGSKFHILRCKIFH